MKNFQDQMIVFKGYKNEESKKAGFPSVVTPPVLNNEQDIQRAIQDHGLDNSAEYKIVTTSPYRE